MYIHTHERIQAIIAVLLDYCADVAHRFVSYCNSSILHISFSHGIHVGSICELSLGDISLHALKRWVLDIFILILIIPFCVLSNAINMSIILTITSIIHSSQLIKMHTSINPVRRREL